MTTTSLSSLSLKPISPGCRRRRRLRRDNMYIEDFSIVNLCSVCVVTFETFDSPPPSSSSPLTVPSIAAPLIWSHQRLRSQRGNALSLSLSRLWNESRAGFWRCSEQRIWFAYPREAPMRSFLPPLLLRWMEVHHSEWRAKLRGGSILIAFLFFRLKEKWLHFFF